MREYRSSYDRIDDLNERINKKLEDARKVRREIYDVIDALDNSNEMKVLEMHFIDDLTFFEIAQNTHYSLRWVERLYESGINDCVIKPVTDR